LRGKTGQCGARAGPRAAGTGQRWSGGLAVGRDDRDIPENPALLRVDRAGLPGLPHRVLHGGGGGLPDEVRLLLRAVGDAVPVLANLSLSEIFDWWFVAAYLWGCFVVYLLATGVAILRRRPIAEAAVEAQCAVIGNTGFLGVPMLVVLLGEAAAGPVLMVLALDLIVFSTLIVILVTGSREGQVTYRTLRNVGLGLLKNPMIVSITLGLIWSSTGWTVPGPVNEFLASSGRPRRPARSSPSARRWRANRRNGFRSRGG
jgi:hypothetical protein